MPKPLAALVIAKMNKKKPMGEERSEPTEDPDSSEEGNEGLQAAAEDVMAALEAGDSKSFMEALKSFVDQCY